MIIIENVPITIIETGKKVLAAIEVHEVYNQGTILKIIPLFPLDYIYSLDFAVKYHIQIGKHKIYTYCGFEDSHSMSFIELNMSSFSVEAWEEILEDEAKSRFVKDTTVEENLLKELNEYFKSDECTISYKEANRIKEIIANVLNGE